MKKNSLLFKMNRLLFKMNNKIEIEGFIETLEAIAIGVFKED